jgi:hypothetical protein
MRVVRIGPLPDTAVAAAAEFYATVAGEAAPSSGRDHVTIVFPSAAYDHRGWRLAAVQDLARSAAPARVNGVVGENEVEVGEIVAYLDQAPGITGQLLAVDGKSGESR